MVVFSETEIKRIDGIPYTRYLITRFGKIEALSLKFAMSVASLNAYNLSRVSYLDFDYFTRPRNTYYRHKVKLVLLKNSILDVKMPGYIE